MEKVKQFHISDVLSITTGRLVSSRHIEGVYDILNWMTGDDLFTHQLPRGMRECAPVLISAYPELGPEALSAELEQLQFVIGESDTREQQKEKVKAWVAMVDSMTGSRTFLAVPKL